MSLDVSKRERSREKSELVDDNARKFAVEELDESLLQGTGAVSFVLTTDWLETNRDSETKLAHKVFDSGEIQILRIKKVMNGSKRESEKHSISDEEYRELLTSSILRVQKERHEFNYIQSGIKFSMKYDIFSESSLRILEVDAPNDEERDAFDPVAFPGKMMEVTGDLGYYGYRVAGLT